MDEDPDRASIIAFIILTVVVAIVVVGIIGAAISVIWWMLL
jgi:nitrate reductase NapE component